MNILIKKTLYIFFILSGFFNPNLYAFSFGCDFVRSAFVWDIGTVEVYEINGARTLIRDSSEQEVATKCHLEPLPPGVGYNVTLKMALPLIHVGSYKLPNGVEIVSMSARWYADIIHDNGSSRAIAWTLYPNIASKSYDDIDKTSSFKMSTTGSLVYYNNNGRLKEGDFYTKIGDILLQYGPSIPIYLKGTLQAERACSVVTENTSIIMPNVQASTFNGINKSVGPITPVNLEINCSSDMPEVSIHFDESHASNPQQGILIPDPTSTSQGIAIQLLDKQSKPIDLTKKINGITADDRFHRIAMQAQYIQTKETIRAGRLNSNISFDVVYQ